MGDIPDSDCPFYEALTPGQWVHSRNQIKHESMLLTVQKSRMKERKNKGTKEGSKETSDDNRFSRKYSFDICANTVPIVYRNCLKCYGIKVSHGP